MSNALALPAAGILLLCSHRGYGLRRCLKTFCFALL